MKKNSIYMVALLLAAGILGACNDYLERPDDDSITEKQAFSRYEKVNNMVSDVYAGAQKANRTLTYFYHFSAAAITDECEGTNVEGNITNNYNSGAWNPSSLPGSNGQFWGNLYNNIRKVNKILWGVSQYNTPDNSQQEGDLENRIGEMYFMRGYLHYLLVRLYGEVPYIDYVINAGDDMNFTKESMHSVADKIVADAQEAYKRVPQSYSKGSENFGRVDKGACLGLIAQIRWMEATPLYNGARDKGYTGTRVFENQYTYDAHRWEVARDAALAVINYTVGGNKRYSLYDQYTDTEFEDPAGGNLNGSLVYRRLWEMFYDMDAFACEAVWFATKEKDQAWQGDIYPPSRGGSSRQQPVQEQVDEYECIVGGYGYPVYSTEAKKGGYDDANPYQNRDPRFYRDIIYHGAPYRNNNNEEYTMNTAGGSDAIGATNATTTGYYLRKFQQESWNKSGNFSISCPPVWRLPEFIYIYAEAVNELSGPNQTIYDMINQVRARSFMKPMPTKALTDQATMRDYIKREWRVEFFYENKRPWMCRLYLEPNNSTELSKESIWKTAGSDNNTRSKNYWSKGQGAYPKCQRMVNGMKPVRDDAGVISVNGNKYRMERFCVEERVFQVQHYLFPIMTSELQRCPTIVQNPGW